MLSEQLSEKIRLNQLFDFYGELLTQKQQTYFTHYYQDDYSLAEIAQLLDVSRNAVFDQIQKAVEHLEHYEATLQLSTKSQLRSQKYLELEKHTNASGIEILEELKGLE